MLSWQDEEPNGYRKRKAGTNRGQNQVGISPKREKGSQGPASKDENSQGAELEV